MPQLAELGALVGMAPERARRAAREHGLLGIAKRAAIAYLAHRRWPTSSARATRHEKSLKMDKQEVKEEAKQQELPAEVRGADPPPPAAGGARAHDGRRPEGRRRRHQPDALRRRAEVRRDQPGARGRRQGPGPRGRCRSARSPREHGVPDRRRTRRSRARLHASVEVGQQVPEELFQAVAQVLAFVYRVAADRRGRRMTRRTCKQARRSTPTCSPPARGAGRGDDDRPAAAVAARPVHHAEHLGRAGDRRRDALPADARSTSPRSRRCCCSRRCSAWRSTSRVTRLILLHGDAGHVVEAFGNFVVGGNVVVGLVIFLILIVIQFVVVTNGAGRVAEVGARFTLDAMPGKQMAIDADLNAGQITDEQARKRREEIAREADFYGAMDGASKFVKGDAMAARADHGDQPHRRHRRRRRCSRGCRSARPSSTSRC